MGTNEATQANQKLHKTSSYACHMCGLNGHKMTDCLKFIDMQKMFRGKSMTIIEVQLIVEAQISTIDVNVVDVNVAIRSRATKEKTFKDRKPRNQRVLLTLKKKNG
jgi:hypothetical protein